MKIVIAIDSFKESLTSLQAGRTVAAAARQVFPNAKITVLPLADGGEGTVDAVVDSLHGEKRRVRVIGPLGKPVNALYGILENGRTAVVEMASAAGLALVPEEQRNPLYTTTYGVGELIRDALDTGCRHFMIGIGGSATNDGGMGMLQALGCKFLDENGDPVGMLGADLMRVSDIDSTGLDPRLAVSTLQVACDVSNPLCGPNGASAVFGPQKGADAGTVQLLDEALSRLAGIVREKYGIATENMPGSGAAGGLGYALVSFCGAKLQSGAEVILNNAGFTTHAQDADLVITGEGRLDAQTAMGKAPATVARMAKRSGALVVAFCGSAAPDAEALNAEGIDAYFPILQAPCTLEHALHPENAAHNLFLTALQVFSLLRAAK